MSTSQGDEPVQDFTVIRTEAAMFQRTGQYEKAIKIYGKALELSQEEKRCLVARSKCFLTVGDTVKALAHAETTLKENNTFYKGILRKAEAMFYNGDFELALVYYHRGKRLRPDITEFSLGIQKASEAIENSVGTAEHVKLNTTGDLSFFDEQTQAQHQKSKLLGKAGMAALRSVVAQPMKRDLVIPSKNKKRSIRQMLGELYKDKQYVENLLQATDDSTEAGKNICTLADECLKYLDKRTDFWQQQKPMYSRLYDQQVFKKRYGRKEAPKDSHILKDLEKIDEAQTAGKHWAALWRATQCLQRINNHPDSQVTNKNALRGQLHSCIGNAHLELKRYDRALKHHKEDFHIGQKFGIFESVCRSLDNIGRVHMKQGELDKAIAVWESKLPLAHSSAEVVWLNHKLGSCYLELGRPMDAICYADQCLEEAQRENLPLWQLQATVLKAQCEVKMKNLAKALSCFENALHLAIEMNEPGQTTLRRAIENLEHKLKAEHDLKEKKRKASKVSRHHRETLTKTEKSTTESTSVPTPKHTTLKFSTAKDEAGGARAQSLKVEWATEEPAPVKKEEKADSTPPSKDE